MAIVHSDDRAQVGLILLFPAVPLPGHFATAADQTHAHDGPFSTLVPLEATLTPPISGELSSGPDFDFQGIQPDEANPLSRDGFVLGVLGGAALAASGEAYLALSRKADKSGKVSARPTGSRVVDFKPHLRRVVWLLPLGAGLTLSALSIRSCTVSEVCYATAGGVQIVVPCAEAEGERLEEEEEEAEKDPSPTPEFDCPDPGRGNTDAYEIAKSGGTHNGYLRQAEGFADSSLQSALTSFEEQVAIHAGRIANPAEQQLRTPWDEMESDEQQRVLTDWCGDLNRNRQLADVIYEVMKERGIDP